MTMEEIERLFDGEWVLIDEPVVDESGWVLSGRLVAHDADKDAVYAAAMGLESLDIAMLFNGPPIPEGVSFILSSWELVGG